MWDPKGLMNTNWPFFGQIINLSTKMQGPKALKDTNYLIYDQKINPYTKIYPLTL